MDINKIPKVKTERSLYLDSELWDDNVDDDIKPKGNSNSGIISLKKQTETGEALQDLNASGIDVGKMHKEDKRTNMTLRQFGGFTALDVLTEIGVIPPEIHHLSIQGKRNSMSIKGWRGNQMVEVAIGVNSKKQGQGLFGRMGNMFAPKQESENVGK